MQLKWDIFNSVLIKHNLSCGLLGLVVFNILFLSLCFVLFLWDFLVDFLKKILSNHSTGLSACIQRWEILFSYAADE